MNSGGRVPGGRRARLRGVVALAALVGVVPGCGGSSSPAFEGPSRPARAGGISAPAGPTDDPRSSRTTTSAPLPAGDPTPDPVAATDGAATSVTPTPALERAPEAELSLDGFATTARSAPAGEDGVALLQAVRFGYHDGFDRIVFEFDGSVRPGYRVDWIRGEPTADGSGDVVPVAGAGTLQVVLLPASGVDMATGRTVYTGPDRLPIAPSAGVLRDLVRTGDFEAVLSWAVGTDRPRPFRVRTLRLPPRVVVDVRAD